MNENIEMIRGLLLFLYIPAGSVSGKIQELITLGGALRKQKMEEKFKLHTDNIIKVLDFLLSASCPDYSGAQKKQIVDLMFQYPNSVAAFAFVFCHLNCAQYGIKLKTTENFRQFFDGYFQDENFYVRIVPVCIFPSLRCLERYGKIENLSGLVLSFEFLLTLAKQYLIDVRLGSDIAAFLNNTDELILGARQQISLDEKTKTRPSTAGIQMGLGESSKGIAKDRYGVSGASPHQTEGERRQIFGVGCDIPSGNPDQPAGHRGIEIAAVVDSNLYS